MVGLAIYGDDNPCEIPYMAGLGLPRFVNSMSSIACRAVSASMGRFEKPLLLYVYVHVCILSTAKQSILAVHMLDFGHRGSSACSCCQLVSHGLPPKNPEGPDPPLFLPNVRNKIYRDISQEIGITLETRF